MSRRPWWIEAVGALPAPAELASLGVGPLWRLTEQVRFITDNVEAPGLEEDFADVPGFREQWEAFTALRDQVRPAAKAKVALLAEQMRTGAPGPEAFRASWEQLGFEPHAQGGGTPADDHLDGMFELDRLTVGEALPDSGTVNLSSRASRIADFLKVIEPGAQDVVFDLGSGSGKLALTVAASTRAAVRGVELGAGYVAAARASASRFGIANVEFVNADVRAADLSAGTVFFLYYPFHGEVARAVAELLGELARRSEVRIYASGPANGFGEFFLRQVELGALSLVERRGEFSEVLVLRSAGR